MLKNYLKIALRNLRRHRGYAFINIFGLAVGLACCLLIMFFVQDELSYDRFHAKADRIYRVEMDLTTPQGTRRWSHTLAPIGPAMQKTFPEIEQVVRIGRKDQPFIQQAEIRFYEEYFLHADPSFFEVFDFDLLQGHQDDLARPYTIVLSETMTAKYFGDDVPIGQSLTVANKWNTTEETYEVVGVMADTPHNAHFQVHFLASFATLETEAEDRLSRRLAYTYLLLKPEASAEALTAKFASFEETYVQANFNGKTTLALMPLLRIHLYARSPNDIEPQGDIRYVYIFSAIALLILLIACINYMNLATARAARRAKEVGVRKVMGAQRRQLIYQFIGESVLFTTVALVLAVALVQVLLPLFNVLMQRSLALDLDNGWMLATLASTALSVGLVAGSYPAFLLSSFQPTRVLKGTLDTKAWPLLRKGLVVFQFAVTMTLIVCTVVIQQQLHFVQHTRLGFDKEHVVILPTRGRLADKAEALKQHVEQHTAVQAVTLASAVPGQPNTISWFDDDEIEDYETSEDGFAVIFDHFWVDHDFVHTLGLELLAGRVFSEAFPSDGPSALLINETTVKALGWDAPLGKTIGEKKVIGVIRDFHTTSMKQVIKPTIIELKPVGTYVAVKLHPTDLPAMLAFLETTWDQFIPSLPFEYSFLDEDFEAMYQAERRLGTLFGVFAGLAVLIACLGLFSLIAFIAEQRTKEIGIRKVFGATVSGIVMLLSKDFARLVLVAIVLAAPLAYLTMQHWLDTFAYRIEISWQIFLVTGSLALAIALATVSYQAIRAALADPVKALRYE